jgi:hypothetical protein
VLRDELEFRGKPADAIHSSAVRGGTDHSAKLPIGDQGFQTALYRRA